MAGMLTTKQLLRKRIIIGGIVLVMLLLVVAVRSYFLSFVYQVPLGKLTSATLLASGGEVATWTEAERLAQLKGVLPGLKPGFGYRYTPHAHVSYTLALQDDQGKKVGIGLPPNETAIITIRPRTRAPQGNSWSAPRLLGLLGEWAMQEIAKSETGEPQGSHQFKHWRDDFGKP